MDAIFYDGETSLPHRVVVELKSHGAIYLRADGCTRVVERDGYRVSSLPSSRVVRIDILEGGTIELSINEGTLNPFILPSSGLKALLEKAEANILICLVVAFMGLILGAVIYRYLPELVVEMVTPLVPSSQKEALGERVLRDLDGGYFAPSTLPPETSARLTKLAKDLLINQTEQREVKLYLRRVGEPGDEEANAFAVSPNTVVVTDELVRTLNDEEIQSILAHEIGHISLDHTTKHLLRESFFTALFPSFFGNSSGLVTKSVIFVTGAQYSQSDEESADRFAVQLLKTAGKDGVLLGRALQKLDQGRGETLLSSYVSSHPLTATRVKSIEDYSSRLNAH